MDWHRIWPLRPLKSKRPTPPLFWYGVLGVVCYFWAGIAQSAPFLEDFEGPEPSWQIVEPAPAVRVLAHQRVLNAEQTNTVEQVRLETREAGTPFRMEFPLKPAAVLDELTGSLSFHAPTPGWTLAFRVVFPHLVDPGTGKTVSILVPGDASTDAAGTRRLSCRTSDAILQEKIVLLRAHLKRAFLPRDLYVDRLVLQGVLPGGESVLELDELRISPLVDVQSVDTAEALGDNDAAVERRVDFRLDRLYVDGRAVFPRILPYQGESLSGLKQLGMSVVWVPQADDAALLAAVQRQGLWATAAPPLPKSTQGQQLDDAAAGLLPFDTKTAPILFWMLGTRINEQQKSAVSAWSAQVEEADRQLRRPLAGDVADDERYFSRYLGMVGISRHVVGSSFPLDDYGTWLSQRRGFARPGSHCWTWVQVEPLFQRHGNHSHQSPTTLEPEQIRHQVYAALMAGYRGIGYWTTQPLDATDPLTRERRLALAILNQELALLEPWLATSSSIATATVESAVVAGAAKPPQLGTTLFSVTPRDASVPVNHPDALTTAVLRTDHGTLLLMQAKDSALQHCPGRMAVQNVSLIVPGGDETALAVEISTTRIATVSESQRKRVAGGMRISLPEVDQTASVLITSNHRLIEELRRQVTKLQQPNAEAWTELARLKWNRTFEVDQQLRKQQVELADASGALAAARRLIDQAQTALTNSDWHTARLSSRNAMQLVRIVQRSHWDSAVRELSSPVSSPYTMSFQTLPDHWHLVEQLGRSRLRADVNLVSSGGFEETDTFLKSGWRHEQADIPGVQAEAELYPEGQRSRYSLRLRAHPVVGNQPLPVSLQQPAVTVVSPAMPVYAGQLVHISGWAKLSRPLQAGLDGAMIYDSILGKAGALRFREKQDWRRFELLREVTTSQDMTVTFALASLGEIQIDDLKIVPHDIGSPTEQASSVNPLEEADDAKPFRLDWLKRSRKREPEQNSP